MLIRLSCILQTACFVLVCVRSEPIHTTLRSGRHLDEDKDDGDKFYSAGEDGKSLKIDLGKMFNEFSDEVYDYLQSDEFKENV